MLANVPACDGRRPVKLEALKAELAEVVDEVFRGEAKNAGNGWKIVCTGFWEVTRRKITTWSATRGMKELLVTIYAQAVIESTEKVEDIGGRVI